jgi:hypothetical protein
MKSIKLESNGIPVAVSGIPTNLQEAIEVFKSEEALISAAVNQVLYHKTMGVARDKIEDTLSAKDGINNPRKTKKVVETKKDGSKVEVDEFTESQKEHVKRVAAERGVEPKDLGITIDLAFDPTSKTRGTGGTIAKMYVEAAESILAGNDVESIVSYLEKENDITIDRDENGKPTLAALAAAVKANKERVEAAEKAMLGLK